MSNGRRLLILLLAVFSAVCLSGAQQTNTTTAKLKHVARLNSLINALQDPSTTILTTTSTVRSSVKPSRLFKPSIGRNQTLNKINKKVPNLLVKETITRNETFAVKSLESVGAVEIKETQLSENYTILGRETNETLVVEVPVFLGNQTELTNATNGSGSAGPNEEPKEGFFSFIKKIFKAITSIDRYTLILTCAFIFCALLIGFLVLIAICVCKRFGNRTLPNQQPEEIRLKSPSSKKKGKSKLDFLDEGTPFIETNLNVEPKKTDTKETDELIKPPEPETTPPSSPSPPVSVKAKSPEVISPIVATPKKDTSSLSKFPFSNITSSLSNLTKSAGFSKNPKGAESATTSSRRQSIISSKLSKRTSIEASQTSLIQRPIYFDGVDRDIEELIQQPAQSQSDLKRMESTQTLDEKTGKSMLSSVANSMSDIYRKALDDKRKGQLKTGTGNTSKINSNPGGADDLEPSICESEQSCY